MKLIKNIIIILLITLLCFNISFGEIIFEDNFDSHEDFAPLEPNAPFDINHYQGESDIPQGYHSYRIQGSYYTNKGHSAINLSSENARGGIGKAVTFWTESDTRVGYASDGQLGVNFTSRDELYSRFYIKFQEGWQWADRINQEKIFRFTHYWGGTPYLFFQDGNQHPLCGVQVVTWDNGPGISDTALFADFRYENTYFPDEAYPKRDARSQTFYIDEDCNYGGTGVNCHDPTKDNQWHMFEFYVKMNSAVGVADGEFKLWNDGVLIEHVTDLAFSDNSTLAWNQLGFVEEDCIGSKKYTSVNALALSIPIVNVRRIEFQEVVGGVNSGNILVNIPRNTYTNMTYFASQIAQAMNTASSTYGDGIDYFVTYNESSSKLTIGSNDANLDELRLLWQSGFYNGSQKNPRLNWNYFTIGGNDDNKFAPNEEEAEQWYAMDDLVIATEYIGPTQCPNNENISYIGTCYCGGIVVEGNTSNFYKTGFCCNGVWQSEECNLGFDMNNNHLIDTQELLNIINAWKREEISMTQTFNYLNKWKKKERI